MAILVSSTWPLNVGGRYNQLDGTGVHCMHMEGTVVTHLDGRLQRVSSVLPHGHWS